MIVIIVQSSNNECGDMQLKNVEVQTECTFSMNAVP